MNAVAVWNTWTSRSFKCVISPVFLLYLLSALKLGCLAKSVVFSQEIGNKSGGLKASNLYVFTISRIKISNAQLLPPIFDDYEILSSSGLLGAVLFRNILCLNVRAIILTPDYKVDHPKCELHRKWYL